MRPGHVVDRYEIEALLGTGGMATVYRVRHTTLGSLHALKVLNLTSPAIRERLVLEGQVQATLDHPNVLAVTDVVEVDGAPGLVMEYVDGPDLEHWLREHRPALDPALALFEGILRAVESAHDAGVVHRDLKPANVMLKRVDDALVPKVADFGLAKALEVEIGLHATRSGMAMGTPAYMAPEQFRDAKRVDGRADVFALGCILYELVTGRHAFEGPDMMAIFACSSSGSYGAVDAALPPGVRAAIEGCLQPSVQDRIQDCAALRAVLAGRPVPQRSANTFDPFDPSEGSVAPPAGRQLVSLQPRSRAGIFVAVVALAAVLATIAWPLRPLDLDDSLPPAPVQAPHPVRIGVGEPVKPTFDLHGGVLDGNKQVLDAVVETLITRAPGGELAPLLLASWTPAADGQSLDLVLREGLRFHGDPCSGEGPSVPVSARDLAWSIEHGLGANQLLRLVDGPDAIRVIDDRTVRLGLRAPAPYADVALENVFLLPAALDGCADIQAWSHPVGTGPFTLQAVTAEGIARLVRNPEYWLAGPAGEVLPLAETLEFVPVIGPEAALAGVASGNVHVYPLTFSEGAAVVDEQGGLREPSEHVHVAKPRADQVWVTRLMVTRPEGPLARVETRRALSAAVDRAALVASSGQLTQVRERMLQGGMLGFDPMLQPTSHDPALAAELLPPDLGPLVLGSSRGKAALAEQLAAQLNGLGVQVRTVVLGGRDLSDAIDGRSVDLVLVGTRQATRGDERLGIGLHGRDPTLSDAVTALRAELLVTPDRDRRAKLYRQIEAAMLAEHLILPIGAESTDWGVFLVHPSLRGGFDGQTGRMSLRWGSWAAWLSLAPLQTAGPGH